MNSRQIATALATLQALRCQTDGLILHLEMLYREQQAMEDTTQGRESGVPKFGPPSIKPTSKS